MRVFTVHGAPPGSALPVRLVPEGFSAWGCLLGPVWLLFQQAWPFAALATLLLVLLPWAIWPGIALLIGLCGHDARRSLLVWRGWPVRGVVIGRDFEDAARRWLDGEERRTTGPLR